MMKIDHSQLKATPEIEDFSGKYEDNNLISKYLVDSYFKSVEKLIRKTTNTESAHEIGAGEGRFTMRLKRMAPNLSASEYVGDLIGKVIAIESSIPLKIELAQKIV